MALEGVRGPRGVRLGRDRKMPPLREIWSVESMSDKLLYEWWPSSADFRQRGGSVQRL